MTLIHTAICIQLANIFELTGARVKREVPVTEFSLIPYTSPNGYPDADPEETKHSIEAIMDVVSVDSNRLVELSHTEIVCVNINKSSLGHTLAQREQYKVFTHPPSLKYACTPITGSTEGFLRADWPQRFARGAICIHIHVWQFLFWPL